MYLHTLGSPRPLMVAKFNSMTQLKNRFFAFLSPFVRVQVCKSADVIKIIVFLQKYNMCIQEQRIWCWFRTRWKSCNILIPKTLPRKKWQSFLLSILWAKKFSCTFSTDSKKNSAPNFTFYYTHTKFLQKNVVLVLAFLLTLKPNEDELAEKNEKNIFDKCFLESHFTSIF